jgi:hypothetical protein
LPLLGECQHSRILDLDTFFLIFLSQQPARRRDKPHHVVQRWCLLRKSERDSLFAYADKTIDGLGLSVTGAFAISIPP